MTREDRRAAKREAREAFIARFNIMSTSGRLYGPDELIASMSRYLGKYSVEHPGKVARTWVKDETFMRRCSSMTPSGVAGEVLNRHFRGEAPPTSTGGPTS
jgi:hypothetical protein